MRKIYILLKIENLKNYKDEHKEPMYILKIIRRLKLQFN